MKKLTEFLSNLLQSINIPGGLDSLSGLINSPADYRAALAETLARERRLLERLNLLAAAPR